MPRGFLPGRLLTGALAASWLAWLTVLPSGPSPWLVAASGLPALGAASWTGARERGERWMPFLRSRADWHVLGLLLLWAAASQMGTPYAVSSDGAIYFSHLRSLLFDRDLEIAAEFASLGQPPRPHHFVPIGPTIVWAPLYLLVAGVDALGRAAGAWAGDPAALPGLSLPYVRAAGLSSLIIGAVGVAAVHARLRHEFARGVAFTATLLIVAATSLWWYLVYEPSMTHAASFGFAALFVVAAARWIPGGVSTRQGIVLGVLLGLAFLTRPQEALFGIVPAVLIFVQSRPLADRVREALRLLALGAAGALPLLVLQALHSYALFSRYRFVLAGEGGYLRFFDSRAADVLFSSWSGFFSWTPIAYVAAIGIVLYLWRDRRWAISALIILAAMAWVNGSTQDWGGGSAFGGRRFTSTLVLLAPGLALVIEALAARPLLALAPVVGAAIWWNHLLAVQYTTGMLPKDTPVSFARLVRQQGDAMTRGDYFYPFAFPANAWFAWRERLPVSSYDLLSPETPVRALDLPLDRGADKFLLGGWDAPGADDWGPARWIGRSPAEIAVPLDLPAGRDVQVEVVARTRFEEPTFEARMQLAVNGHVLGEFRASADEPSTHAFTVPAAEFGRVWRTGYNRVSLASLGVVPVNPSDTRPPGPLARRAANRPWPVAIYRLRILPVP